MAGFSKSDRQKICQNVLSAAQILKETLDEVQTAYKTTKCKDLMYIREALQYSECVQAILEELNRKHGRQSKTPGKS